MEHNLDELIICQHCSKLQKKVKLPKGKVAKCIECKSLLYRNINDSINRGLAFSITALILFIVANLFPIIKVSITGVENPLTIIEMIYTLFNEGFIVVGSILIVVLVIAPLSVLLFFILFVIFSYFKIFKKFTRVILSFLIISRDWEMVDIFAVSILVALVKLFGYAEVHFGLAAIALLLFVLVDIVFIKSIKSVELWDYYCAKFNSNKSSNIEKCICSEDKLISCEICESVNLKSNKDIYCRTCNNKISIDDNASMHRAWAMLITAMVFYVIANSYPILVINKFGHTEGSTIIGGAIALWEEGSYPISIIIFLASVFVPILKFILILYILINYKKPQVGSKKVDQVKLHHITEVIGPWSMIDVFVVSILAGVVHMSSVKITAGIGATAFVLMVFFTMLSAMSIDIRLIKERKYGNK